MADYNALLGLAGRTNPWADAIQGIQQHLVQQEAAERQRQLDAIQLAERNERLLQQQLQRKAVERANALTEVSGYGPDELLQPGTARKAIAAGIPVYQQPPVQGPELTEEEQQPAFTRRRTPEERQQVQREEAFTSALEDGLTIEEAIALHGRGYTLPEHLLKAAGLGEPKKAKVPARTEEGVTKILDPGPTGQWRPITRQDMANLEIDYSFAAPGTPFQYNDPVRKQNRFAIRTSEGVFDLETNERLAGPSGGQAGAAPPPPGGAPPPGGGQGPSPGGGAPGGLPEPAGGAPGPAAPFTVPGLLEPTQQVGGPGGFRLGGAPPPAPAPPSPAGGAAAVAPRPAPAPLAVPGFLEPTQVGGPAGFRLPGAPPPAMPGAPPTAPTEQAATPEQVQPLIVQMAQRLGVDPDLALAVASRESRFNPAARSPKGAIGVMQLMPETAQELGVDPYDLAQNIEGGVRYLKQQLERFGGNVDLALAAYNAGPTRVAKLGRVPNIPETTGYVGGVQADAARRRGVPGVVGMTGEGQETPVGAMGEAQAAPPPAEAPPPSRPPLVPFVVAPPPPLRLTGDVPPRRPPSPAAAPPPAGGLRAPRSATELAEEREQAATQRRTVRELDNFKTLADRLFTNKTGISALPERIGQVAALYAPFGLGADIDPVAIAYTDLVNAAAYALARSEDPGGRLSKDDVALAAQRFPVIGRDNAQTAAIKWQQLYQRVDTLPPAQRRAFEARMRKVQALSPEDRAQLEAAAAAEPTDFGAQVDAILSGASDVVVSPDDPTDPNWGK